MKYVCEVYVLDGERTTIVLDSPSDTDALMFLDVLGTRLKERDFTLSAQVTREVNL